MNNTNKNIFEETVKTLTEDAQLLHTYDISYKEIKCNNFMQNYYNK